MSDYKPTEHGGLRQDGQPDKRVGTGGTFVHTHTSTHTHLHRPHPHPHPPFHPTPTHHFTTSTATPTPSPSPNHTVHKLTHPQSSPKAKSTPSKPESKAVTHLAAPASLDPLVLLVTAAVPPRVVSIVVPNQAHTYTYTHTFKHTTPSTH